VIHILPTFYCEAKTGNLKWYWSVRWSGSVFSGHYIIRPHFVCLPTCNLDHGLYKGLDDNFRIRYAELWRSLMMADLQGIKDACHNLGVDKAYALFAAMLTARPFDEIIERSKTGSFTAPGAKPDSQADRAVIRGYAQQYMTDIFSLLDILPRQMLLLLKMNDCLRHIDYALGSPTNTLVVAGKFASRAVYEDQRRHSDSWTRTFQAWFDYRLVIFRIQLHDFAAWFLQTMSNSKLLTASR
jgi:predicted unusual protein kinase regulating ubiquinone biosynthesis (AarF/ABC1/UbiB family)